MEMIRLLRDMYAGWDNSTSGGSGGLSSLEPKVTIVFDTLGKDKEWVKIESDDDLPEPGVDVWVFSPGSKNGMVAHLMSQEEKDLQSSSRKLFCDDFEGNWWNDPEFFIPTNKITHWMDLPKPPKI